MSISFREVRTAIERGWWETTTGAATPDPDTLDAMAANVMDTINRAIERSDAQLGLFEQQVHH